MKRNPKVGDMIMIGTSTKPLLVVEAEMQVSRDEMRGDAYHAYTFSVISDEKLGVVNPKLKHYVVAGASMKVNKAIEVALDDLFLADNIKLKKKVVTQTTYTRK